MSLETPITDALAPGKRVAVTLQSSFLGFFAHAGFLNALLETGIRPAKIAGASSGSLVASAFASGIEGDALHDFATNQKIQRSFRELLILLRAPAVFGFYIGQGIVTGNGAVKHLRDLFGVERIEDTPNAELSIGVTNLTAKERQIKCAGPLAPFVVASCAVSPVVRAQQVEGDHYLDGGFTDDAPFDQWIDDPDVDTILIHRIAFDPPTGTKWSTRTNFLSCWAAVHDIVTKDLTKVRIARAREKGKTIVIHETTTSRPPLIASSKLAASNYELAFNGWKSSPLLAHRTPAAVE